ncbi:zinc-binding protein A33-like [Protopterus annectens]|uniref:zinc-binding protein A33-like n=1 Tax=Protopterus annectens TaxID=7888 RepID=UPI001CFB6603|nr:zinc-binding protein A33-like [Protopterus annectens]
MEDFSCSVCFELLKDPVILDCGHNFCRACIDKVWDSQEQPSCPECRNQCPARKYIVNRLLVNAIQMVQTQTHKVKGPDQGQKNSEHFCRKHEKKLKLFCEEDESLACLLCVPEHRCHSFLPLLKAVAIYKDKLASSLCYLQSKLKDYKEIKYQQETKISEVTASAESLQLHIASEFSKLQQFLKAKEEKLIKQLEEEESRILRQMKENLRKVRDDISAMEGTISDIQQQIQQQDAVIFLKEIKSFKQRLTKCKIESERPRIVACDLSLGEYSGPLQYGAWKEMKPTLNPGLSNLLLDPKTAHVMLVLSEDLKSVRLGDKWKKLPNNPERFYCSVSVLGSKGFTSGRHYWEVGVKNKNEWDVGVVRESINRQWGATETTKRGYWTLCLRNGNMYWAADVPFYLGVKLQRIGVYLDYEGGQVSFYNADNMSHLYTFKDTFTERVYPCFSPGYNYNGTNVEPLKIFHLKL